MRCKFPGHLLRRRVGFIERRPLPMSCFWHVLDVGALLVEGSQLLVSLFCRTRVLAVVFGRYGWLVCARGVAKVPGHLLRRRVGFIERKPSPMVWFWHVLNVGALPV